ncbi:phage holin family protein [Paenibacillus sp. FSL M8-0228]|uniref:phage holin family protein n=1 Tax=Paenibacillus TaxID=44249 RepID=UPI002DB70C14|nr:phage holin family protein [Paenibacillus sp. CMAA1739]MEC4566786.1 phage holin family protein [Paenibacillus sp. CMAA1739]
MDDRLTQIIKGAAAGFGAVAGYLFGGWSVMIHLLFMFVIADWLTGWIAAWIRGELRSRIGYHGIARKVVIFLIVVVAHFIDVALGNLHYFQDAVIFFYLANELLSIIENVGRMGVPMPDVLRNAVKIFESRSQAPKNPNMPDPEPDKKDQGQKPAV